MDNEITVIITDDKPEWREQIVSLLNDSNIKTIGEAGDGEHLLVLLKTITPHIILLDLSMPGMDGNKTMNYLSKTHPEIKVIIFSSYDEQELVEHYIERGAKGYVSKNRSLEDLVTAINKVYRGGKFYVRTNERESIKLTPKNKEYMHLVAEGKKRDEIATSLGITSWGVDRQKKKVIAALNVTEESLLKSIFRRGFNFFSGFGGKSGKT